MSSPRATQLIPIEHVEKLIHLARGEKVLLDADLARLYGVETKALNRAVRRNRSRFPQDFMFQLTAEEAETLRCQIGTSKSGRGGRRYLLFRCSSKSTGWNIWNKIWSDPQPSRAKKIVHGFTVALGSRECCHRTFSFAPSGLGILGCVSPAMNRWAIVDRPMGLR